ncbi:MAG: glycosyltransferase [Candidatus Micrarchaeia archaeon]
MQFENNWIAKKDIYLTKGFFARLLTVSIFIILGIASIGFSLYLFYIARSFYMYFLASLFMVLALIACFFNFFASVSYYKSYFYQFYIKKLEENTKELTEYPTLAVAMPVFNENVNTIKKNFKRLLKIRYPKSKLKFYLLDDSTESSINSELERFSKENGIIYIHRDNRKGYKAGALNNLLKISKEEYLSIFDYDEYLANLDFAKDLLKYFMVDPNLSYVQTQKDTKADNFFSDSIRLFDGFFFTFIQPARALNNTAIYAGSCGMIKKSAIEKIGGFPEYVIEDTFFSFESHKHNFKSLYIPKIYAYGEQISTFTGLAKQQWRYNYGDTEFLGYFIKNKKKFKSNLIIDMDYITHGFGLNYLSVVLLLFTFISVLIVFSSVPFLNMTIQQFFSIRYVGFDLEVFGIVAFMLSMLAPVLLTKIYFNSVKRGFMVFLLNYALAVIRTKAAIYALLSKSPKNMWNKMTQKSIKNNLLQSIKVSSSEIAIAAVLLILSIFALKINVIGALWLVWYATMYLSTFFLFYKYG